MNLPEIPYGDWITAAITILYLQLLASKKRIGWLIGLLSQGIWIYLSLSKQLYGLTALASIMTVQFLYGWINSKETNEKAELDQLLGSPRGD